MKNKNTGLNTFFYLLLFRSIGPAFSFSQVTNEVAAHDTTGQDTVSVKRDSIAIKMPQKIVRDDTTFTQYMKSPWQLQKSEMNQYFHEDLGDLLVYFPGSFMLDPGSSGQRLVWTRHGVKEQQATLFFDGRPLYDPIHGGIDLNLVPPGFTNSMTIEQGLSSPYSETNAEILSLVSESYDEDIPYSQVSYHKAPYGFSDIDVVFGQKVSSKANILLGGIIKSYDGKTDSYRFDQQNFRGKVDYQLTPSWHCQYSWISNKIKRHIPDPVVSDTAYQATDATQKLSRLDQALKIKGRLFEPDFRNFQANFFYSTISSKLSDKIFDLKFTDLSRYAGFNFQLQKRLWGQRITSGADFIHEWTDADQVGSNRQSSGAIFIRDDWDWKQRLGFRASGSYQFHNIHGARFSGGLGSFVAISKNVKITASAKQSIRYPTFFELNAKTDFIGASNLTPEIHQTIEAGLEWQVRPDFSLTSSFYHKNVQDAIQFSPLDSLTATFANQQALQYSGVDSQLKWAFLSHFRLNALVSTIDNSKLVNMPALIATGYVQYTGSLFQGDIRPTFRIEGRYFGTSKGFLVHPYRYIALQENLNPASILNAHVILDLGNVKIFITLENILNSSYQLLYGYPMNERTLHYGLRWEFWN